MHRVTKKELEKKIDYINFKLGIETGLKGSYILYKDLGGYELHLIDGIITGIQARENLADAVQA